jgi:hypothetical protein
MMCFLDSSSRGQRVVVNGVVGIDEESSALLACPFFSFLLTNQSAMIGSDSMLPTYWFGREDDPVLLFR